MDRKVAKMAGNITFLRECRKMSQDDLALELKVSVDKYKRWENGVTYPNIKYINEMAKIFNCDADIISGQEQLTTKVMEANYIVGHRGHNKLESKRNSVLKCFCNFVDKMYHIPEDFKSEIICTVIYQLPKITERDID